MTSPKATARGLWLLSNNTYTYQEFDGVTRWIWRCQEWENFSSVLICLLLCAFASPFAALRGKIRFTQRRKGRRKDAKTKLNDEAEALEGAIEVFKIERFRQINVRTGFERRFFHAVNVVRRNGHDGRVVAVALQLAEAFDRL